MTDPNNILALLTINSLIIHGIHANADYDEDGRAKVFAWMLRVRGPWWFKRAFVECFSCMSSFHSLYVYWPWIVGSGQSLLLALLVWPLYMTALAGLNNVAGGIINLHTRCSGRIGSTKEVNFTSE